MDSETLSNLVDSQYRFHDVRTLSAPRILVKTNLDNYDSDLLTVWQSKSNFRSFLPRIRANRSEI
jgi:hypothetical protein